VGQAGQADDSYWLRCIGFKWHKDEAHSKDKNLPFVGIACSQGIMSHGNVCCTGAGAESPEVEGNASQSKFEILKEKGKKNSVLTWPGSGTCNE
jgi:hypothetical protein